MEIINLTDENVIDFAYFCEGVVYTCIYTYMAGIYICVNTFIYLVYMGEHGPGALWGNPFPHGAPPPLVKPWVAPGAVPNYDLRFEIVVVSIPPGCFSCVLHR